MKVRPFLVLLAITFFSCNSQKERVEVNRYFGLSKFMNEQVLLLTNKNARLLKTGNIKETEESVEMVPDSSFWASQLEIFSKADLNKPVLVDAYEIIEAEPSKTSNLLITRYTPIIPDDVDIRNFEIHYLDDPENIRIIKIWELQTNELYAVKRELKMEFDQLNGDIVLQNYQVRGFQKMQTRDTVFYDITGNIEF